jgi:hexosaminidase
MLLIPTPSRIEMLGGVVQRGSGEPRVRVRSLNRAGTPGPDERSIAAQAYTLEVTEPSEANGGVMFEITTAGHSGRRYAQETIRQLLRQYPHELPRMRITDEPTFATRGVMLDISRNRVPTMADFFDIIDSLAALKFNHLQLYTEHTFAYAGHEQAWVGSGALSPDEVRRLDERCHEAGIELAANQNCFGHLAHWLKLDRYSHLAETHGDWMFDVWPRSGPFSLCPVDDRSLDLVRDWLDQLLPCLQSPLVNIGADETFDVGWGRSKDEVARIASTLNAPGLSDDARTGLARARVYAQFVNRVCGLVRERGRRPMFWADIALSHPEVIAELPRDLVALAWGYEPHSPFDRWCADLRAMGNKTWVCPGTSSWRSITGRTRERDENLRNAAIAGEKHHAPGYLVCDWGDTGHHQQWPIALHALAKAAQAAWSGAEKFATLDSRAISLHVHGDASLHLGAWLDELGNADEPLRRIAGRLSRPREVGEFALWNQSALFADLYNCGASDRAEVGDVELWKDAAGRIEDAWVAMPQGLNTLVQDELEHTINAARLAARRAIARRCPTRGVISDADASIMAAMAKDLLSEHRRLWLARSRRGGLDISSAHYERIIRELESRA